MDDNVSKLSLTFVLPFAEVRRLDTDTIVTQEQEELEVSDLNEDSYSARCCVRVMIGA